MDVQFLQAQITAVQNRITEYNDTLLLLAANPEQSYTINSGQTVQTVTYRSVKSMEETLDGLYNRLAALEARLYGSGLQARPGW